MHFSFGDVHSNKAAREVCGSGNVIIAGPSITDYRLMASGILSHVWRVSPRNDRVWTQVSGLAPNKASARLLLVLQAFIDESFDDRVFVLGGYIASAETWAEFSEEWESILEYALRGGDGDWRFKMVEMAQTAERIERSIAFFNIIKKFGLNITSISVAFRIADHRKALERIYCLNAFIDFGDYKNPYIVALSCLLLHLCEKRTGVLGDIFGDEKIDFIFDEREGERSIVTSAWDRISVQPEQMRRHFGATPRFERDEEFLPLQAADMLCWWTRELFGDNAENKSIKGVGFGFTKAEENIQMRSIRISMNEDEIASSILSIFRRLQPVLPVFDQKRSRKL